MTKTNSIDLELPYKDRQLLALHSENCGILNNDWLVRFLFSRYLLINSRPLGLRTIVIVWINMSAITCQRVVFRFTEQRNVVGGRTSWVVSLTCSYNGADVWVLAWLAACDAIHIMPRLLLSIWGSVHSILKDPLWCRNHLIIVSEPRNALE